MHDKTPTLHNRYPLKNVSPALCSLLLFASPTVASAGPLTVTDAVSAPSDFPIVVKGSAAAIVVDEADAEVVRIAADLLAGDVERVSGVKPGVHNNPPTLQSAPVIVIGTLGKNAVIADLVKRGKLDVRSIEGKWESFVITGVADPFPGVTNVLVIAGSDRRGTAYGALSLSEAIGVSPWEWWADVPPQPRETVVVSTDTHREGPPSVKYRGIFINDEDWGLQEWSEKNYESGSDEAKDIGPKTYAKVFELLLRLKANYCWPAMHPSTKAFNSYPGNKVVADRYAIVMGSSHAEPMLRNNVDEWDKSKYGDWNYDKNRDMVYEYWENRVKENGRFENVYTVGMRGIHDSGMPGGGSTADKVARLGRVITDQREMLTRHVNPRVEQVPQIFVPYKEVLTLYENGLKVPEDVTLVWPDDNHGYIRRFSTPDEQKRSGGAGVYYHISYWGAPEDYLWLCTTPPALIWEEMRKAYDHGARAVWVVNVGDIKPHEIGMEFFLRMAWNIEPWNEQSQPTFLKAWSERNFGKEHAAEIAAILNEYYRLNYPARPEHLLKVRFNQEEKAPRLARFGKLVEQTNALYEKLPQRQQDAFYQLVVYPVRCSAFMNQKHLSESPEQADRAHEQIQAETAYYNEQLAGGKWRHIMSANPRGRPVYGKPALARTTEAQTPGHEPEKVLINIANPSRATALGIAQWKLVAGLGRSGGSIALLPTTAPGPESEALEYEFSIAKSGPAKVRVYCIPTHAIHPGSRLRYSVAIDSGPSKDVDIETREFSREWAENVVRAAAIGTTEHGPLSAGQHTLRLRPLDAGLVFDRIEIEVDTTR